MSINRKMDELLSIHSTGYHTAIKTNNENEQAIVKGNNIDKSHKRSQTQKNTYSMIDSIHRKWKTQATLYSV